MIETYRFKRRCGKCLQLLKQDGTVEAAVKIGLTPDCRASRLEYALAIKKQIALVWDDELEQRYREEIEADLDRLGIK